MKTASWAVLGYLAVTASAIGGPPERPAGKPTKMENFKWADPWAQRKMKRFDPACSVEKTFLASEFLLDDLSESPPLGLKPFSKSLKKLFQGREYPGSWDGIDPHGYDRNLLMMEYAEVPIKVKEWIEDQEINDGEGKGLFAVYPKPDDSDDDKSLNTVKFTKPVGVAMRPLDQKRVVIFAPGAVYDILPLWVAENSTCQDQLLDISKYSSKLSDGGVVAWPTKHTKAGRKKGRRNMKFTVKAQLLKAKVDSEDAKEEL